MRTVWMMGAAITFAAAAAAQDTRQVTEPVVPQACTVLHAKLTAVPAGPYQSLSPADESRTDTDRIQDAIDSCGKGKAVVLRKEGAANAFLSGPLTLRSGVTLVVDGGTTLFAVLDPNQFSNTPGSCGLIRAGAKGGCKPFITVRQADHAGIMGDGVIDARAGIPIPGLGVSDWDIAQHYGSGQKALPHILDASHSDDFTLYRITLRNSPNFNVTYNAGDGLTVWGVKIETPRRVPHAARPLAHNTDGIDPGNGARNITITRSFIRTGDDNIAIKGSKGGVSNMTVSHNHFYWGHGMSIGSETYGGVKNILVTDLTLDGTDAGIRIKSNEDRGGLVENVTYDDICMRNVAHPIEMMTHYEGANTARHTRLPVYRNITLRHTTIAGGGSLIFDGYDESHHIQALLDGVYLTDSVQSVPPYKYTLQHADIHFGPGGSNLMFPAGNDATITGTAVKGNGDTCTARFIPFTP